ncbi:MAG: flagellar protein FlgN [Deltaproteobacteria bacterium]|jgi:hypothetical protein|nr:flagellar protein FlgN [Deltaproteobacteria bacterium]
MDIRIIRDLEEALEGHLGRYRELIDFLDKEKRYLLNMDLDGLYRLSKLKEELARTILEESGHFTGCLSSAGAMLGLPEDSPPTLVEVAALCPKPYANRLADGAMTLARLKNQILQENEQARRFVEESLGLVNESINILSGANTLRGEGYGQDGKKGKGAGKCLPAKLSRDV